MISALNHITLAVSNVERSLSFYRDLLGLDAHAMWDSGAYLSVGGLWLCLSLDAVCAKADYTHVAFDVPEQDFKAFTARLQAQGVHQWKDNSSEGDSFYFLDPDGHRLELHVGSLCSRLKSLGTYPYPGLQWLDGQNR